MFGFAPESTEAPPSRSEDRYDILVTTDGVFSMDGTIANLADICALAEEFDALTMIDDAHATGFLGERGRATILDAAPYDPGNSRLRDT